jgi:hypothetical protein
MKYLQDYMEDRQTELFKKLGTFFCFSKKQFEEGRKEGVEYINMGTGMITPKGTEMELITNLDIILTESIAQDIAENTIPGIIERELYNHEAFYTCDIKSTVDYLEAYKITVEQIRTEYNKIRQRELTKQEA